MSKRFNEYTGLNLPQINEDVLRLWDSEDVFHHTMSEREGCPSFVFFEGPPSANGKPGIHHVLARTIKDLFCRYKTMKGYQVKRKAGWDTHGLPVELGVEKNLGITKEDIGKKISVDEYNAACRREVMKFTGEWEDLTRRMGYWVDMPNAYITYDNRYIETVWWLLGELYKKGYLYKGYTIQPYSPAAGTGLSSHELNQEGCYRDVKDTTATAIFEMLDPRDEMKAWGRPVFLAWTTTPWTLPSNTALCVGPKIEYVCVQTFNPYTGEKISAVMARECMDSYFKPEGADAEMVYNPGDKVLPYRVTGSWLGSELTGIRYRQLMPWVKPVAKVEENAPEYVNEYAKAHPGKCFEVANDCFVEIAEAAFRVIPGDYVTTTDGTGIVHIAPTFGADDAKVARLAGIPSLFMINHRGETRPMVDLQGKYYPIADLAPQFVEKCVDTALYSEYAGAYVKPDYETWFNPGLDKEPEDLNVTLSVIMKREGQAFRVEKHVHSYPHCWRTDKPVLYYPLDSWFIRSTAARERMMELNEGIKWKPAATGSGRFGKWLENLQDWNLSRSRYWGTPLPIWRTEDAQEEICIQSVKQLYGEIDRAVEAGVMKSNPLRDLGFEPGNYDKANYEKIDLHRPYVDDIVLLSPSGKPMYREKDLIDVWFDSGSMPYAQIHYPFENKEAFDTRSVYPADFIAEGVDQTRGWFFTLHAIAAMLFDSVAYKAVVSNGLVLDKYGNKMSKHKGNTVDPFGQISTYGPDPVRWYMMANSAPWDNLKYDEKGVLETSRKLFGTLYNTYSFFALYANVDGFDPEVPQVPVSDRPEIDRWILSLLNTLTGEVTAALDDYEPTRAARAIAEFVGDNLSNWYVRLNRRRFWGGEMTTDKLAAYQTLYTCLRTLALLMAPFAPFYSERLWRDLTAGTEGSVHLARFPEFDPALAAPELERRQKMAQDITSMALALRKKENIKVRQPLGTLMVPVTDDAQRATLEAIAELVKSELNIKELRIVSDDQGIIVKRLKPDFKKLGPKHGKNMKAVAAAVAALDTKDVNRLEREGSIAIDINGTPVTIDLTDVEVISEDIPGWLVANDGSLTIALDITVTPELEREGIARDLVNRIQRTRKERKYDITDRISLTFERNKATDDAIRDFADYIAGQVLATGLKIADGPLDPNDPDVTELDMDDVKLYVKITK